MKKLFVVNGYIGLDLSNESSDKDSDILFYRNFKLRFWILRTNESLSIRLSGKVTTNKAGSALQPTAALQEFYNLLDDK